MVSASGVGPAAATVSSSARQNSTKVTHVLATSSKLVRTSIGNVFVAPMSSSQASSSQMVTSSPARKRLKLSDSSEKATAFSEDVGGLRRRILEYKLRRMRAIRDKYAENAAELFFLHAGGNMMDYHNWRKRPPTPQYLHFLRQHPLDPDDDDEDLTVPSPLIPELSQLPPVITTVTAITTTSTTVTTTAVTSATSISTSVVHPSQGTAEVKISGVGVTPVAVSTTLPAAVAQLNQQGKLYSHVVIKHLYTKILFNDIHIRVIYRIKCICAICEHKHS